MRVIHQFLGGRPGLRRSLICVVGGLLSGSGLAFGQVAIVETEPGTDPLEAWIAAGNYTNTVDYPYDPSPDALQFTNNGTFSFGSLDSFVGLWIRSSGGDGGNSGIGNGGPGGSPGQLIGFNNGNLTMTDPLGPGSPVYLSAWEVIGGNGGGSASNADGGAGGQATAALTLTNTATLTILGGNVSFSSGGSVLAARSLGGSGGSVSSNGNNQGIPTYDGGNSGAAGSGGNVTITQSGELNFGSSTSTIAGDGLMTGLLALSMGGDPGAGQNPGAGAGTGSVNVTNFGSVNVQVTRTGPSSDSDGFYGILAQTIGGDGMFSSQDGVAGSNGGAADIPFVTLEPGSIVSLIANGNDNAPRNAAVAAMSLGGQGGNAFTSSAGGVGGSAGMSQFGEYYTGVFLNGAFVEAVGNRIAGVVALNQAGDGGSYGNQQDGSSGGAGAQSGRIDGILTGVVVEGVAKDAVITTYGNDAPGFLAATVGGAGGDGIFNNFDVDGSGGFGGAGGQAGEVSVTLNGTSSGGIQAIAAISTVGSNSTGLAAFSTGGNGGDGGGFQGDSGSGGAGGNAGDGGGIEIVLDGTVEITTNGTNSTAILARSSGGVGGNADTDGSGSYFNNGDDGGNGGDSGDVAVTTSGNTILSALGDDSLGIVAQSLSGGGGLGGSVDNGISGGAGKGGSGGNTGNVTIQNAATITTSGNSSTAILAQALSGAGGVSGNATGFIYAGGGGSTSSGIVGSVNVSNSGSIHTGNGSSAFGLHAQSIAGGGGAAGSASGGLVSIGGSADTNPVFADGGAVNLTHSGSIITGGNNSIGILGQSVGGGGGSGGYSDGLSLNLGGTGGAGGDGGTASVTSTNATISTSGFLAHGVVIQSIGGGGGVAGNATGVSLGAELSIGGGGGTAGNGSSSSITMENSSVTTRASNAIGLVAMSLGGGGGSGGGAFGGGIGIGFGADVTLGGNGTGGGNGGEASVVVMGGTILTGQDPAYNEPQVTPQNNWPVDAFGVVAQSVGGGGGNGGSSSAVALSAMFPTGLKDIGIDANVAYASGGNGSLGGNGGTATITLQNGAVLGTQGQGSHGAIAQSIGGGGGLGGDSSASSATLNYGRAGSVGSLMSFAMNLSISQGGSAGAGGDGGTSQIQVGGGTSGGNMTTVTTYGDYANGLLAQSIGGGGGNAGFGSGTTQAFGSTNDLKIGINLGATGGEGGSGGNASVTLEEDARVVTYGSNAMGALVQSIGGGGGNSQGGSVNLGLQATFPVFTTPGNWSAGNYTILNVVPSIGLGIGLGSTGAAGGNGSQAFATVDGTILTHGGDATGVLVQSIGGGGGVGGSSGSDASADNPATAYAEGARAFLSGTFTGSPEVTPSFGLKVGSTGGGGGSGSEALVTLSQTSNVTTFGDWAQGVLVQSIGGGGGKAGSAASTKAGMLPQITISLSPGSTGEGGDGGAVTGLMNGGTVSTGNAGTNGFAAGGYSAFGVVLQSIGGGGGLAADGSDFAMNGVTIDGNGTVALTGGIFVGGNLTGQGGGSGNGGAVEVTGNGVVNSIQTLGDAAHGVLLQSIGGGGGIGGAGSTTYNSTPPPSTFEISTISGNTTVPTAVSVAVGGGETSLGAGGSVILDENAPLAISTAGDNAFGVLAQSIGGGGGLGAAQNTASTSAVLGGNFDRFIGESFKPDVNGGSVNLTFSSGSEISTSGNGSIGLVAQSVGGGGGVANYAHGASALDVSGIPDRYNSIGSGGNVSVTLQAGTTVSTTGAGAHGVLAQSVGTGGGLLGSGSSLFAGSTGGANSEDGFGLLVHYSQAGSVSATGENSVGVFLQSTAAVLQGQTLPTGSTITASIGGNVTGGSGLGAGVWVDGGDESNTLTVSASGRIQAASGIAVKYSTNAVGEFNSQPLAMLEISNFGTILGSVNTGGGNFTNTGFFQGSADLDGARLSNEGTFSVTEDFVVSGDFSQSTGLLKFSIGGVSDSEFGSLNVSGQGTFGGSLQIELLASYAANVGDRFLLITGNANAFSLGSPTVVGGFDGVQGMTSIEGNSLYFEVTAVPEPAPMICLLLTALFALMRRTRSRAGLAELTRFVRTD